ncbi:hypothetical protein FHG87_002109 [Trinorchestia longiramus]|nr:hypothetical protein FHG87_002109 [Trinorchestia longiramus]
MESACFFPELSGGVTGGGERGGDGGGVGEIEASSATHQTFTHRLELDTVLLSVRPTLCESTQAPGVTGR